MAARYVIGIDEVGRGPLAGPVVVAAVAMPLRLKLERAGLRDSKRLTAAARAEWNAYIRSHPQLGYALARVRPATIDQVNISRAANLAARRAFTRLVAALRLPVADCVVYLDGGLYLGNGRARLPGVTRPKADENVPAVALASIVAKVHRDGLMARASKKFPGYGFEVHKGYGTRAHRAAVRRLGPSALHRLTFMAK